MTIITHDYDHDGDDDDDDNNNDKNNNSCYQMTLKEYVFFPSW